MQSPRNEEGLASSTERVCKFLPDLLFNRLLARMVCRQTIVPKLFSDRLVVETRSFRYMVECQRKENRGAYTKAHAVGPRKLHTRGATRRSVRQVGRMVGDHSRVRGGAACVIIHRGQVILTTIFLLDQIGRGRWPWPLPEPTAVRVMFTPPAGTELCRRLLMCCP